MAWWNRIVTRAELLRSELLAITMLIGLMLVGVGLSTLNGVAEKEATRLRLEEEAFIGTEPDSLLARELSNFQVAEKQPTPKAKLNFNIATEAELLALPEIGPTLADRLVRFRKFKGGKLNRIEELLEVKGITPERLEKLKENLEVQ
ncbi:MAG: ComEA family DNA-binding protein [Chloroherpetonaceae bacterium]